MRRPRNTAALWAGISSVATLLGGCHAPAAKPRPSIVFTRVPQADKRTGYTDVIGGRATGANPQQRLVLYARNGDWWLQPLEDEPFTEIGPSGTWFNGTHLGTEYAALLVDRGYVPPLTLTTLPEIGGKVQAITSTLGKATPASPILTFGGYEWRVRTAASRRGGANNDYLASNAWVSQDGAMHLRIAGSPTSKWTCAEVALTRNLGFGTYKFVVGDTSKLEPATVLSLFTFDYAGSGNNNREANIEVSRWGDPISKNAQYVVQPFHVPSNVYRFSLAPGTLTHTLQWTAGRMLFRTTKANGSLIAQHEFTSGVPNPGLETIRIAFYAFHSGVTKLSHPEEVVVDRFEYLP